MNRGVFGSDEIISIHALLAESDSRTWRSSTCGQRFQSTLSLRRATVRRIKHFPFSVNFNPRSPCGERPTLPGPAMVWMDFNPRSPCGERPRVRPAENPGAGISIHALLAESDPQRNRRLPAGDDFNPRSPCGERLSLLVFPPGSTEFQSTLSLRRATCFSMAIYSQDPYFNPRSPCGERQQIPPNWPYRFCLKCQFKDGEKSKKAKGSASAQASSPAYEKNKVRIPWGDFECFRFAPIK